MTIDMCLVVLAFSVCLAVKQLTIVSSVCVNRRTSYVQVSENNTSDSVCYNSSRLINGQ